MTQCHIGNGTRQMKREVEQKQERTACHSFAQSIEKKLPKPLNTCTLMLLHHCVENPKPKHITDAETSHQSLHYVKCAFALGDDLVKKM